MPRGKSVSGNDTDGKNRPPRRSAAKQYKPRVDFAGWVNCEIPREKREEVTAWGETSAYGAALADMVAAGHKVTLAYDAEEEVYVATTFQTDAEQPTAGLMTSQRSDDLWRALLKLCYAHAELLPTDYSALAGGGDTRW